MWLIDPERLEVRNDTVFLQPGSLQFAVPICTLREFSAEIQASGVAPFPVVTSTSGGPCLLRWTLAPPLVDPDPSHGPWLRAGLPVHDASARHLDRVSQRRLVLRCFLPP